MKVHERLAELAAFGATAQGIDRALFTAADHAARRRFAQWAHAGGLAVEQDRAGNVFARLDGGSDGPPMQCGSHLDTVRNGGAYDGAYGVVGGLEALERIAAGGAPLRRPLEVVAWAGEEGSRFPLGCLGSSAYARLTPYAEIFALIADDGQPFADALAGRNGLLDGVRLRDDFPAPAAYIELHIEQGPVLEGMGLPLGVVLGTKGVERHAITFHGQEAHSGSTPMKVRRDALAGAAKLALEIRNIAGKHPDAVCTMGSVKTFPGIVTAVVGRCEAMLDQRDLDATVLAEMYQAAREASERFAREERCTVDWSRIWSIEPIPFHPQLVEFCASAIHDVTGQVHRLPSGPLHDAAEVARCGIPTVMMFVQSLQGISHNKIENTKEEHLALAVEAQARLAQRTAEWISA